jgi:membrane protein YdbS with pleckstrin-like domain
MVPTLGSHMPRAFAGLIARLHMKRFQAQVDIALLEKEGRIFSSFSLIFSAGILILYIAALIFLLGSAGPIIALLLKWVELFKIREIFSFTFMDAAFIARLYRLFLAVVIILVSVRTLLRLLKCAFSVVLLSDDGLIIVDGNLLSSRIHQIPYDRISRVSARETILHRVLRLGTLEILTGERDAPLRFGPVPRFPSLVAALMPAIAAK